MKTVLKSLVVGLVAFTMSLAPVLTGMAQAGGINYEGMSPIKTDYTQIYEKQPSGLMLNFSFGAPKDYKTTRKQNDIPISMLGESKDDATAKLIAGTIIVGALVAVVVLISADVGEDMPGANYMEFGSE